MSNTFAIQSPQLLHIADSDTICYGANQSWYPTSWQRNAGCGPTNCTHLLWYLSQTREDCRPLCPNGETGREPFTRLMETVWRYVTPGSMGVHSPAVFAEGAVKYGKERGVPLEADVLRIPTLVKARPAEASIFAYLSAAFAKDLPVAFLNLSNGALENLENWHWVTLVGLEGQHARMYDQGESHLIDLALWLKTSSLGGGFVTLVPKGRAA